MWKRLARVCVRRLEFNVPLATAIPDPAKDDNRARRRRIILKNALAFLIVLLLMVAGLKGRQHARLQGRVEDVTAVRDQLQRSLDDEHQKLAQALANGLKARLRQFDGMYNARELPKTEDLEIRLSRATLANGEQRFSDALVMVTEQDEKAQTARRFRILQVRADAFYGLREWQNALDRFREMLALQPNRLATLARIGACEYALGRRSEAMATYAELVKRHKQRADELSGEGKSDDAKAHYEKAAQVQGWLEKQEANPGPKVE